MERSAIQVAYEKLQRAMAISGELDKIEKMKVAMTTNPESLMNISLSAVGQFLPSKSIDIPKSSFYITTILGILDRLREELEAELDSL